MKPFWVGFLKKAEDPFEIWASQQSEAEEKAKNKKSPRLEASEASRDYTPDTWRPTP